MDPEQDGNTEIKMSGEDMRKGSMMTDKEEDEEHNRKYDLVRH